MNTKFSSDIVPACIPRHLIAERAYAIWAARGRPLGSDYDHWVEAEQQLLEDLPVEDSLACRLTGWSDVFGTDIERALDSMAPTYAARSVTSL
jgi:hypothetical protein